MIMRDVLSWVFYVMFIVFLPKKTDIIRIIGECLSDLLL